MRRRRLVGRLLLFIALVVGSLAWLTAWGTHHSGFGFESTTVPAAMVTLASVAPIAVASVVLDRPIALSLLCVVAATLIGIEICELAQDIPGATSRRYPVYEELYRSRILALWVLASAAVALFLVGAIGLWLRHPSGATQQNRR